MKLFWCVALVINFCIYPSFAQESCEVLFDQAALIQKNQAQAELENAIQRQKNRESIRVALEKAGYGNLEEIARTLRAVGKTMAMGEKSMEDYIVAIADENFPGNPAFRSLSLKFSFEVIHFLLKNINDWNKLTAYQKLSLRILLYVTLWGNTTPSALLPEGMREEFKDLILTVQYRTSLNNVFNDPSGQGHMNHFFIGYVQYSYNKSKDYEVFWEKFKNSPSKKKKAILEGYIDLLSLGYLQPSPSGGAT